MPRFLLIGFLVLGLTAGCGGSDSPGEAVGGVGGAGATGGVGGEGGGGTGGTSACEASLAPAGEVGGACRGETMSTCNGTNECIQEIDVPAFVGGYCTLPVAATPSGCDPEACQLECGTCVLVAEGVGLCMRNCEREVDSNGACRDGYECELAAGVCFPGCASDDECREEENPEAVATCNQETFRCEHPGTEGAEAGDACAFDEDCEPNGLCLLGPDGYCSKFGCDVEGNECAGEGTCLGGLCLQSCTVGTDPESDPITNTQGCREGYGCFWDRLSDQPSGICDIGVFNPDVTVNNIGDPCTSDDECYSPFGYGTCDVDFGCTVIDCGAPGVPEDICGDEATCIDFLGLGIDLLACLRTCADASPCNPGDACIDVDGDPGTVDSVCFPLCTSSDECREGEVCDVNNQCVAP